MNMFRHEFIKIFIFFTLQFCFVFLTAVFGAFGLPIVLCFLAIYTRLKISIIDFCKFVILFSMSKNIVFHMLYSAFYPMPDFIDNRIFVLSLDFQLFLVGSLFFLAKHFKTVLNVKIDYIIILAFLAFYFVLGVINSDLISAITYFRVYFGFFMAVILSHYCNVRDLSNFCFALLVIYLIFWTLESVPNFWQFLEIDRFFDIKYGLGHSKQDYLADVDTIFFGFRIVRFLGLELHPISAGYSLLFLYAGTSINNLRLAWILAPVVMVAVFFSSKGALAGMFLIIAIQIVVQLKLGVFLKYLIVISYGIVLIALSAIPGLSSGYSHFLGLLGGINQMIDTIVGNGIGYGGTQSSVNGFVYGSESGLGFILSHVGGFGAAIYLIVFFSTFRNLLRETSSRLIAMKTIAIATLLNGVLQEEAFFFATAFPIFLLYYTLPKGVHIK